MDVMSDLFGGQRGDGGAPAALREVDKRPPGPVFFALNPDADGILGAQRTTHLLRVKDGLTGPARPPEVLHVSLLGIGRYPELRSARVDAACAAAEAVTMRPFEVAFDRAASFGGGLKRPLVLLGGDGVAGIVML